MLHMHLGHFCYARFTAYFIGHIFQCSRNPTLRIVSQTSTEYRIKLSTFTPAVGGCVNPTYPCETMPTTANTLGRTSSHRYLLGVGRNLSSRSPRHNLSIARHSNALQIVKERRDPKWKGLRIDSGGRRHHLVWR